MNAFNELYDMMAKATNVEPSFFIASVISPMPNLKIKSNGLELDKTDFLITDNFSNTNTKAGDSVLLVRVDEKLIIIDKVVY